MPLSKPSQQLPDSAKSGVSLALFSIYSKESQGIGDFSDLKLAIDWVVSCGNSILQLLPMNEVGPVFCPYDSLSSFALEPSYLSFSWFPAARDKNIQAALKNLRKSFPLPRARLDYSLRKERLKLLRQVYELDKEKSSAVFFNFQSENSYWLPDFCLYKVLKEIHNALPWYEWEDKYRSRDPRVLLEVKNSYAKELDFQAWLQWRLYEQFKVVRAYARVKNILLKGDQPFLVSRDSADVWQHPDFFKLDFAAGAPPDMYCAKGQRWGMPTHNWHNIEADGFRYLKEKLKYAGNFYDILRIDHVVGLFRIWSIPYNEPLENKGLNGFFDPRDEKEWAQHGRNILSVLLNNTSMLLCAEDLGVIPKACTASLQEFAIPGNEVQRWVKEWKVKHDFLDSQEYRAISVAMLSTHDTTNWPAWWENEAGTVDEDLFQRKCHERHINFSEIKSRLFDPERSKHGRLRWKEEIESIDKLLWNLGGKKEELPELIDLYQNSFHEKEKLWKQMQLKGPMREKSDKDIVREALKITLNSSALFCINTIVDWLYLADIFKGDPYEYRINTPGIISDKNWSLVIPISLDELLKHRLNRQIKELVLASDRR
ncbi:MAG TPA: 4-alpha-glucanotransferase [Candidatus Margulisiibacteriota bacterium]|nr:4-alpha-glucanotransferase [Candidatus Margulisiibacteriota bacterium]